MTRDYRFTYLSCQACTQRVHCDQCQTQITEMLMRLKGVGKGNLLFHMRGKQAFSFYNRKNGKSVRLVLKPRDREMSREESFAYYQDCEPREMFDVKEATIQLPERARLFDSYVCECCGEKTGANWIRIADGKKLCLDCYKSYDRFNI